ncbi:DUF1573 domain-containing protein [Eisenibacter elegans]|uniref:DUF1573 domain-containing protein n=1 Tax=Eisenibacter elegans TaxID=997 RepID=UPI000424FCD0|nr:DUF1573 domain-containing protein [Eisenibacter elegans]
MKKSFVYALALAALSFTWQACGSEAQSGDNTQAVANSEAADTQSPANGVAAISFAESSHDFGMIGAQDVVKHVFVFTNSGDAPLIINNAQADCGCTVPKWPREPIAPGASGEIEVEFSAVGKSGNQMKRITLYANTDPATTQLTIKANINTTADMKGPIKVE